MRLLPVTRYSLLVTCLQKKSFSFLISLLFLSACSNLISAPINVTAALSRNRVAAGDMVQLDIQVTGAQQADVPQEIPVDGLQIKLTGQSSQVQMVNFSVTSSVLYSYIVMPLRSGTFTIPSITVRTEGKYLRTSPQQLTVVGTAPTTTSPLPTQPVIPVTNYSAPSQRSSASGSSRHADTHRLGFAELVMPKKKFYVGEVVPVEIRFYVDGHYNFATMGPPDFGGEGVLVERFKDPEQSRVEGDGNMYNVATYRTLLSTVKPGALDLAPVNLNIVVQVPESTPMAMDADIFSRMLGGASPFVREHKLSLKTEPLHLEVMPLPQEGKPDDFSGAVGEFHLEGSAAPRKAAQGDPVTLSLQLSGKGNFQSIKAPELTEIQGWRTYPPADHFDPKDSWGWKGVKTFETTMIAQQPLAATPGSLFSYFDPTAAKYVTLTTKPFPIDITAAAPGTPVAASAAAAPTTTLPKAASASPSTAAAPIAGQPLEERTLQHWKDPLHRKEFILAWLSLFSAAIVLATYLGLREYQRRGGSPRDRERRHVQQLLHELQNEELDAVGFYNKAAQCAELLIKQDASRLTDFEEILKRRDEINYGARKTFLKAQERQRILERFASNRGKN